MPAIKTSDIKVGRFGQFRFIPGTSGAHLRRFDQSIAQIAELKQDDEIVIDLKGHGDQGQGLVVSSQEFKPSPERRSKIKKKKR